LPVGVGQRVDIGGNAGTDCAAVETSPDGTGLVAGDGPARARCIEWRPQPFDEDSVRCGGNTRKLLEIRADTGDGTDLGMYSVRVDHRPALGDLVIARAEEMGYRRRDGLPRGPTPRWSPLCVPVMIVRIGLEVARQDAIERGMVLAADRGDERSGQFVAALGGVGHTCSSVISTIVSRTRPLLCAAQFLGLVIGQGRAEDGVAPPAELQGQFAAQPAAGPRDGGRSISL